MDTVDKWKTLIVTLFFEELLVRKFPRFRKILALFESFEAFKIFDSQ